MKLITYLIILFLGVSVIPLVFLKLVNNLSFVFITTLIFVAIISTSIAYSISKPITDITKSDKKIIAGQYKKAKSQKIQFLTDEIAEMVEARQIMLNGLVQKEALAKEKEKLKIANIKLRKLDTAKTEFLSSASHELKSPIVPVSGYLQMLSNEELGKLNKEQKKAVAICYRNTENLIQLMNNLLDLSKLELDNLSLLKEKFDLVKLAKEIQENFNTMSKERYVDLQLEAPKSLIINADRLRITQVISNLVKNALTYAPGTEKNIKKVLISINDGATTARLEVIDEGPGISRKDQAKLFNKFFRAKSAVSSSSGGSGLGLCISRAILLLHGGAFSVKSELGKGSTFSFTIQKGGKK
jgi:signal transduction histidine kinase